MNQGKKKGKIHSPYKGKDNYIFVSYAHKNSAAVMQVIEHLQNNHYRVWYDEGIDPGTEWDENIASHVENCYCFLAFLSKEYLESSNCKDELTFARELDKPRLLIYMEELLLPSGMRMRLNRLQAIHMYKYENVQDFYLKLYEFSAMQNCKEAQQAPVGAGPRIEKEFTLSSGRKRYSGVLIGQGFAGQVYKAYDDERKEEVVFKTYNLLEAFRIPLIARCDLEDDMRKLNNVHLCRVFDVVRGSVPAVIMDYVEGRTLSQHIKDKKLSVSESLQLVHQLLDGLSALHEKGIFYGDVTPYNIMISNQQVILCDYSESNYNGSRYDSLTMLLHKYRSPERNPGKIVDFRSDLYEAGMILDTLTLNLVSGSYASEMYARQKPIVVQKPDGLSAWEEQLFGIIEKATKTEPDERYDSAAAMMRDIDEALSLLRFGQ